MLTEHGEVVAIEYRRTARRWHPHSIETVSRKHNPRGYVGYWDAEWSHALGELLVHESGGGPYHGRVIVHRFIVTSPPPARLWLAPGVDARRYLRGTTIRKERLSRPLTDARLLRMGYQRLAEPMADPFADARIVGGHIEYCRICDDWFDDEDNAPCAHLRWSDQCAAMIGAGADDSDHKAIRESVAAIVATLTLAHVRRLREEVARGDRWVDAGVDGRDDDAFEAGALWLATLGSGRKLAKARRLTVSWLDALMKAAA